jgi:peroxiredoxin
VRATFIVNKQGKIAFVEHYNQGDLPDPDKILAEVKKLG